MQTLYANVVNFKVTPAEIVLEFGNNFPERPTVGVPPGYQPDIRIVLAAPALPGLAAAFQQAANQQAAQVKMHGTPPAGGVN